MSATAYLSTIDNKYGKLEHRQEQLVSEGGILLAEDICLYKSLPDIVVEYIRNKILLGEYKEGDRIPETEVAAALGISRAPVREGIKELASQGLIQIIPRKGSYVVKLSIGDLQEIYKIRLLLENSVIESLINESLLDEHDFAVLDQYIEDMVAISQRDISENEKINLINEKDAEFHHYLWVKSGSQRICKILTEHYSQLKIAMIIDKQLSGVIENRPKEHIDIVKYLKQGDVLNCKKALLKHIMYSFDVLQYRESFEDILKDFRKQLRPE